MKNLIPILLLFITGITYSQLNTEPPKIITEIGKKVKEIDTATDSSGNVSFSGNILDDEIQSVKLISNKIAKIEGARKTDSLLTIFKFYFSYNKLIYAHVEYKGRRSFTTITTDSFYYDYDELVSKPKVIFTENDTIYPHVQLQLEGYSLLKKYIHLRNYNPFENLQYNNVVAYAFDGRHENLIVNDGKLDKSAILPGRLLTPELQDKLIKAITDSVSYGGIKAACFEPHLGIVFYQNNSIVAHVSICFECNFLNSSIYLPAEAHHLYQETGDDYVMTSFRNGFSPQGRKQLKQLCHELGLDKCPEMNDGTIWDE